MGPQDRHYTRDSSVSGNWDDQVQKDAREPMELAPPNTFGSSATFELVR
jgi:hypothetical protein